MKKIRMVIETSIPDDADAAEAAENFALLGSEDSTVLTVVTALDGVGEEDAKIAAAGDSLVATLAQHFPGVFDDPEVNVDAAMLLADVLGSVVSLQLTVETEVEAAETIDTITERFQKAASSGADKLRSMLKREMN